MLRISSHIVTLPISTEIHTLLAGDGELGNDMHLQAANNGAWF